MNSFGEYLRSRREDLGLPLRKVAAELDIDTSILSKIERNERNATKDMLPILSTVLEIDLKDLEVKFIGEQIQSQFGDMKNLKEALKTAIQNI